MTNEQIISNIEQAPAEMQVMVAKAYIRDDIDNEDVQYHFNEDTIEEMNENGSEEVEHVNAPEPEGIGAEHFVMRTSKPSAGNKNYITKGAGGWNTCIKGCPQDKDCNVLANCVGYVSGRANEIINEMRGTTGCTYTKLNCNAENFIERAEAAGLKIGTEPKVGAIGVAQKGATLKGGDGAGHVWMVEKVNEDKSTYTSESAYGSTAFYNQTRRNDNGRWGLNANYKFRGFIYLPDDVQKMIDAETEVVSPVEPTPTPVEPTPAPTPEVPEWPKYHTVVKGDTVSGISKKYYGKSSKANWDLIKNANGLNSSYAIRIEQNLTIPNPETEAPVTTTSALGIGDKVKIIGSGNGSSYGTGHTAYGIGWKRQILDILDGRAYPYKVGNSTGTTGYYKAEALEKQ